MFLKVWAPIETRTLFRGLGGLAFLTRRRPISQNIALVFCKRVRHPPGSLACHYEVDVLCAAALEVLDCGIRIQGKPHRRSEQHPNPACAVFSGCPSQIRLRLQKAWLSADSKFSEGCALKDSSKIWVVPKIMVPFWYP